MQTSFNDEYNVRFSERWEFERSDDGVILVAYKQLDTSIKDEEGFTIAPPAVRPDGQPTAPVIQRSTPVWTQIANDDANRVMILTGHEGHFYNSHESVRQTGFFDVKRWHQTVFNLPRALGAYLDLPMPIIGAAIGEAIAHGEYMMLADIVIAGESAVFGDTVHMLQNSVPGDGINAVLPLLVGWNRGRSLLLTGRRIAAAEALELGLVQEVVPDDQVVPRCKEIARELLNQDEMTLRLTARVLRQQLKAQIMAAMEASVAMEGLLMIDQSFKGPR